MWISYASIAKKYSRAEAQRRRRGIFVENQSQKKIQPRQGRHLRERNKYVAPDGAWWKMRFTFYNYFAPVTGLGNHSSPVLKIYFGSYSTPNFSNKATYSSRNDFFA